jgi:hypothetical protein
MSEQLRADEAAALDTYRRIKDTLDAGSGRERSPAVYQANGAVAVKLTKALIIVRAGSQGGDVRPDEDIEPDKYVVINTSTHKFWNREKGAWVNKDEASIYTSSEYLHCQLDDIDGGELQTEWLCL